MVGSDVESGKLVWLVMVEGVKAMHNLNETAFVMHTFR